MGAQLTTEHQVELGGPALAELWAAHYSSLVRLAALLLDDVAASEDVVQEAYIRVHLARRRADDERMALAYLRQTVVNLARSSLRRRVLIRRHATIEPTLPTATDESAIARVAGAAVVQALRTLPRRQREAVVLRYYGQLTEREAAAVMEISIGTVKSTTARGLAALEATLEER